MCLLCTCPSIPPEPWNRQLTFCRRRHAQVDLANNRLSTLHASISNCRLISRLNLADNLFTSVPPVVCTLTALTDLKFERNEVLCVLTCFTDTKSTNTDAKALCCEQLTVLTPLLGNLVELRVADFRYSDYLLYW